MYARIPLSRLSKTDFIARIFYDGLQRHANVMKEFRIAAAASFESVGTGAAAAHWCMDNDHTRTMSAEF